jgi:hypothetical protein
MRRSIVPSCVLFAVALISLAFVANAQIRRSEPEQHQAFRAQIEKQLAGYKHGDFLYQRCEIFQKIQERRAAAALGAIEDIQPMDIGVSDTSIVGDITRSSSDENETSIALSRWNPNIAVAGANDAAMYNIGMPIYFTSNAGSTWRTYRMPALKIGTCMPGGDPMLTAGPDSMLYYAYLIYDNEALSGGPGTSDIIVARSSNGKIWTHGRPVMNKQEPETTFEDKEAITVDLDTTSPYYGRIYLSWVHYDDGFGSQYLTVAWSSDQGESWSAPVTLSDSTGYFSSVKVGRNGVVFISSSSTNFNFLHSMLVSYDGGETFQSHSVAEFSEYPQNIDARSSLKGDRGFRAFPYTSFDVDRETNKLYMTYGTWEDSYAAIMATTSIDDGRNWATPIMIGSEGLTEVDHFLPWVSFDQVRHRASVAFYSSESDPDNNILLGFNSVDFDSLSSVKSLSADNFNPLSLTRGGLPFIGDYVGADAHNGYYAAAWTQNRKGHSDGDVFAFVRSPNTLVRSVRQINSISYCVAEAYPSPSLDGKVNFTVTSVLPSRMSIRILDLLGRTVVEQSQQLAVGSENLTLTLSSLPAGSYRALFDLDGEATVRTLVIGAR